MDDSDLSQSFSPETLYNNTNIVSKPRGIGLHLNSIVAGQRGNSVTAKQSCKGMVKLGRKSLIISGSLNAQAVSSDSFEKISSISEPDLCLTEPVEMATPNELLLAETAKPLELAESSGESNQAGLNTRRKQASNSGNPDGCKRCSCKKSKCLKLYCDCFAAGLYCLDSCSCQGCFNRPEHKESVIEARQLIESRNPLAFSPKIMQHVTSSPSNSGESSEPVAQPPLRHKRGCNCRKSMCLKKYCECYEANVGCSDGCRCEGCKNVYGKKPDYNLNRHFQYKRSFDETSEETPEHNHKLLITSRNHLSTEKRNDLPVAVPVTPSSDSRKIEMKSLRPGRRYVLSPDPNHTPPSAKHQSSSRSSLFNLCHFTRLTNTSSIQEPPVCEVLKSELNDESMDNETPMILRDCSAPAKSVKVRSPNKKRISPPHNHLNELLPQSSSGEMRISRKFIFKSVTKFPPLSPCLDSNNSTDHHADTH